MWRAEKEKTGHSFETGYPYGGRWVRHGHAARKSASFSMTCPTKRRSGVAAPALDRSAEGNKSAPKAFRSLCLQGRKRKGVSTRRKEAAVSVTTF